MLQLAAAGGGKGFLYPLHQVLFMKRSLALIASVLLGAVAICYTLSNANSHTVMAFTFIADVVGCWAPLFVCCLLALFALIRYGRNRGKAEKVIILCPVIVIGCIITASFFEEHESSNPVLLQASTGDAVGGLTLALKTGNIYTVQNTGGIGYTWCQGKYTINKDTILLTGATDVLAPKLFIRRDTTPCPQWLAFRVNGETTLTEKQLRIVKDSIFCH